MASKFLKSLRSDSITVSQILIKTIFGNDCPGIYDANLTYNIGDMSLILLTDVWYLVECNTNGTTGAYNPSKWNAVNPFKSSIDCGTF